MQKENQKPIRVDRRDFIKVTTLAGMAGTLPAASLLAQDTPKPSKPRNAGKTRKVLFVSDSPSSYEKLIDSIKGIREYEFQVIPIQVSLQQKPQDVARSVRGLSPDSLMIRPYRLRDYHGLGKGANAEVEFPMGIDVTLELFSKDLKSFVLWPGKTQPRVNDIDRPPIENAPTSNVKVRKYCSNQLAVKLKDIDRFTKVSPAAIT